MAGIPAILLAWNLRDKSVLLSVDPEKFYLLLVFEVAVLIANTWTAVWSVALLRTREWRYIAYIQVGLGCLAVLFAVKMLNGGNVTYRDILFPVIFVPYFARSIRVLKVFKTHDWNESPITTLSLTQPPSQEMSRSEAL